DRARPGDHLHRRSAQRNAAHVDDGARLVPLPRHELVRLDDVHRTFDTGQRDICTLKPWARIRASTAATSVSPASGCITMIMFLLLAGCCASRKKQIGRPFWGRPTRGILELLEIYARVRSPWACAQK